MRKKEGMQIEKEFFKYLNIAHRDLKKIKTIQDKVFTKKVNSKSNIDAFDELGKIEISEEIDRINSHLEQISQSIKSPQLSGKKINFILQEINRESNTIMSKFLENFKNIEELVDYFNNYHLNLSKNTLNSYLKSVINA